MPRIRLSLIGNYAIMMKYLLLLGLTFLLMPANAQVALSFCEEVTDAGQPHMSSNSFMVDGDGGVMKMYIKADNKLNTSQVDFKVYYLNNAKEEEVGHFTQKTEPAWNYAWKEVAFFEPGNYRVKAYASDGSYLTSANLIVKKK